ncbi:hypothetical protein [Flavobacterium sp.]|jgi:hypothetical protein|uniref:hypothetical protein n=1 Tax=Flavobacterium sp. TaxID=239 RepID=UPI0037BE4410
MKKIIALILLISFSVSSCSNDNETQELPQGLTVVVNGATKVFNIVSVEETVYGGGTPSEYSSLILRGEIATNSIERIVFTFRKGVTGKNAFGNMYYVDNEDREYYYFYYNEDERFIINVIKNDFSNLLQGKFYGKLYENGGPTEINMQKGSFNIQY